MDEGLSVSCRLEIVDEVGLEVSADLEDGLGSWQVEKTLVLRIEGNIIETGCRNAILRECCVGCGSFPHLLGRAA